MSQQNERSGCMSIFILLFPLAIIITCASLALSGLRQYVSAKSQMNKIIESGIVEISDSTTLVSDMEDKYVHIAGNIHSDQVLSVNIVNQEGITSSLKNEKCIYMESLCEEFITTIGRSYEYSWFTRLNDRAVASDIRIGTVPVDSASVLKAFARFECKADIYLTKDFHIAIYHFPEADISCIAKCKDGKLQPVRIAEIPLVTTKNDRRVEAICNIFNSRISARTHFAFYNLLVAVFVGLLCVVYILRKRQQASANATQGKVAAEFQVKDLYSGEIIKLILLVAAIMFVLMVIYYSPQQMQEIESVWGVLKTSLYILAVLAIYAFLSFKSFSNDYVENFIKSFNANIQYGLHVTEDGIAVVLDNLQGLGILRPMYSTSKDVNIEVLKEGDERDSKGLFCTDDKSDFQFKFLDLKISNSNLGNKYQSEEVFFTGFCIELPTKISHLVPLIHTHGKMIRYALYCPTKSLRDEFGDSVMQKVEDDLHSVLEKTFCRIDYMIVVKDSALFLLIDAEHTFLQPDYSLDNIHLQIDADLKVIDTMCKAAEACKPLVG